MFCSITANDRSIRRGLIAAAVAVALFAARVNALDPPTVKATFTAPPTVKDLDQVVKEKAPLAHAVVYVMQDMGNGRTAAGTGTAIAVENGKTLVLTNAHVAQAGYSHSVTYWSEGKPYTSPAKFIEGSQVTDAGGNTIRIHGPDLALLEVNAELRTAELADEIPAPGQAVSIYGFGGAGVYGTVPIHKTGRTLAEDGARTMAGDPIARTSIETVNGDSGAGIFNDAGQLVAVHWGGGAVRLDTVHSFTVNVLHRNGLFSRFKDRIAARRIGKQVSAAVAAVPKTFYSWFPAAPANPPPVKSPPIVVAPPFAGACVGGSCAATGRGLFGRRR